MSVRLGNAVRELRLHLCQSNAASKGAREFITKYYVDLKKTNPKFPFLIRECSGVQPKLWVRYDKGVEASAILTNKSADEVLEQVKILGSQS